MNKSPIMESRRELQIERKGLRVKLRIKLTILMLILTMTIPVEFQDKPKKNMIQKEMSKKNITVTTTVTSQEGLGKIRRISTSENNNRKR